MRGDQTDPPPSGGFNVHDWHERVVDELAKVLTDRDAAELLAKRAGFPEKHLPPFQSPLLFWAKVVELVENGITTGGVRALVRRASAMYPGNGLFRNYLEAKPHESESGIRVRYPGGRAVLAGAGFLLFIGLVMVAVWPESASGDSDCTIRIREYKRVFRVWLRVEGGGFRPAETEQKEVSFECSGECKVDVVVELLEGRYRHWDGVVVAPEQPLAVDLGSSLPGVPQGFRTHGSNGDQDSTGEYGLPSAGDAENIEARDVERSGRPGSTREHRRKSRPSPAPSSSSGDSSCRDEFVGGDGQRSYIWIANSSQGTVSKIDTLSMKEEGRYRTRPDSAGSPARTSVSLSGDVGVANRGGGVVKIHGKPRDCQESNGIPGLQTSTGATDLLAWGQEECVAWYTPLAYSSNRPVAWTQGEWDPKRCSYRDEKLWTAGANGANSSQVLLLDGETGVVEQTVDIPEVDSPIGLYGGAVDRDGDFWGIDRSGNYNLIRVDRQTFAYQVIPGPGPGGYGITVDSAGRPWYCAGGGAWRYDPVGGAWSSLPSPGGNLWGGCMTDGEGTLRHGRQKDAMLVGIDTETLQVVQEIQLPAYAHGVSMDFDGHVWAVGFVSSRAYRVDPMTGTIDTVTGLQNAYTYSDMTGFALSAVEKSGD